MSILAISVVVVILGIIIYGLYALYNRRIKVLSTTGIRYTKIRRLNGTKEVYDSELDTWILMPTVLDALDFSVDDSFKEYDSSSYTTPYTDVHDYGHSCGGDSSSYISSSESCSSDSCSSCDD